MHWSGNNNVAMDASENTHDFKIDILWINKDFNNEDCCDFIANIQNVVKKTM